MTAQKRSESAQKVPIAVTPYTAETLEKAQIRDLAGLAARTPGLIFSDLGTTPNTPSLGLRGISMQESELSVDSGIGLVVDGVPLGVTKGANLQAFDVERIEVLRGPQGTLFGKNTTGGTINVIRTRPNLSVPFSGKARVTLGSFGRNDYDALLSATIIPDRLGVLATITSNNDNGAFYNVTRNDRSAKKDLLNFRVAVRAKPIDNLDINVSYERSNDHSGATPYYPLYTTQLLSIGGNSGYTGGANYPCFNPYTAVVCTGSPDTHRNTVEQSFDNIAHIQLDAVSAEIKYNAGDLSLVSVTGYRKLQDHFLANIEGTRYDFFLLDKFDFYKQFSQELRLESNFSGAFNFIVGGFFYNSRYRTDQVASIDVAAINPVNFGLPGPVPPGTLFLNSVSSYLAAQKTQSRAIFFQGNLHLAPRLELVAGGRLTWDRKRMTFTEYAPVFTTARDLDNGPVVGVGIGTKSWRQFTPKIGLNFQATPDVLLYASFSKGYNAGGFNGRAPSYLAIGPYNPEKLDAYEIGIKSSLLDHRLRVNLSAFYNKLKNKQEDVVSQVGAFQFTTTVNAAATRYVGGELEITALPVQNWTVGLNASYLNAKYTSFFADLGQGPADFSDLRLRRAPKWTASLNSDYVIAVGPGKLGLNAALLYTSSYETNVLDDPRGTVPKQATVEASVRYEFDAFSGVHMTASVFGKNLTDSTLFGGNLASGNSAGTFFDAGLPRIGRTWGVSLSGAF